MVDSKKPNQSHTMQVSVNLDTTPILYTDNINMNVNAEGVVLNIMQALGPSNQVRIVSRIGMSRDHAKQFVVQLGKLLAMTEGQSQTGQQSKN